jgi:hypothetical protein
MRAEMNCSMPGCQTTAGCQCGKVVTLPVIRIERHDLSAPNWDAVIPDVPPTDAAAVARVIMEHSSLRRGPAIRIACGLIRRGMIKLQPESK